MFFEEGLSSFKMADEQCKGTNGFQMREKKEQEAKLSWSLLHALNNRWLMKQVLHRYWAQIVKPAILGKETEVGSKMETRFKRR